MDLIVNERIDKIIDTKSDYATQTTFTAGFWSISSSALIIKRSSAK